MSVLMGCYQHDVSVGLANGQYLGCFKINDNKARFADFFEKIEHHKIQSNSVVSVAMEGYICHARPFDRMIQSRYHLLNIKSFEVYNYRQVVNDG